MTTETKIKIAGFATGAIITGIAFIPIWRKFSTPSED